jgi:hypothetical protein
MRTLAVSLAFMVGFGTTLQADCQFESDLTDKERQYDEAVNAYRNCKATTPAHCIDQYNKKNDLQVELARCQTAVYSTQRSFSQNTGLEDNTQTKKNNSGKAKKATGVKKKARKH